MSKLVFVEILGTHLELGVAIGVGPAYLGPQNDG